MKQIVPKQSRLFSFPLSLAEANSLVEQWHRTHERVACHRFSIGAMREDGTVCGAAIVGYPVANKKQDQSRVAEVTRLVTDGTPNACSFLYAACTYICDESGYRRLQTYIPGDAKGTSLKALKSLGWKLDYVTSGVSDWGKRKPRNRFEDSNVFVLDDQRKARTAHKQLWAIELNPGSPNLVPKIQEKPLRRICVRLYDEDCVTMEKLASASGESFNLLIREAIHTYCVHAADRVRRKIDAMER